MNSKGAAALFLLVCLLADSCVNRFSARRLDLVGVLEMDDSGLRRSRDGRADTFGMVVEKKLKEGMEK